MNKQGVSTVFIALLLGLFFISVVLIALGPSKMVELYDEQFGEKGAIINLTKKETPMIPDTVVGAGTPDGSGGWPVKRLSENRGLAINQIADEIVACWNKYIDGGKKDNTLCVKLNVSKNMNGRIEDNDLVLALQLRGEVGKEISGTVKNYDCSACSIGASSEPIYLCGNNGVTFNDIYVSTDMNACK